MNTSRRAEAFAAYVLVIWVALLAIATSAQVPTATEADRAFAQLAISRDGNTVTVRGVASDALQVCVEPRAGQFGVTRCYGVGAIRRGDVRTR